MSTLPPTEDEIYKKTLNDLFDNKEISEEDFLLAAKMKGSDFICFDEATEISVLKWPFIRTVFFRHFEKTQLQEQERQPCEVWTRVMGYFRPVSEFNQGKKAEFYERRNFSETKATQRKDKK